MCLKGYLVVSAAHLTYIYTYIWIDFNPVYGFWYFLFLCYNEYSIQIKDQSKCKLRKLICKQKIMSTRLPDEMSQLFSLHPAVSESGSLSQSILSPDILHELQRKPLVTSNIHNFTSVSSERLLPPIHQKIFHQELADMLCLTYHKVYIHHCHSNWYP